MKLSLRFFIILVSLLPLNLAANTFKTYQWKTSNGMRVIFYPAKEVPILNIHVAFAAGSAYDGATYGLSYLTAGLLDEGTTNLSATQIAQKLDNTGAQYKVSTTRDMVIFSLKTLTAEDAKSEAIDIFSQILTKANFPQSSFERKKQQQLIEIAQAEESPNEVANKAFFANLYKDHPYGHPVKGVAQTVEALTLDQVKNFYQQYYVSTNGLMVLVGAINKEEAKQIAEKIVATFPSGQQAAPIPKATNLSKAEKINIPYPSSQTIMRLGQVAINFQDLDYFPLIVGQNVLGSGTLVSRLAYEVREKRGLTYGIASEFLPMPARGPFVIALSTNNKEAAMALQVTQDTLQQFVQQGPTDQEVKEAKQNLIGNFPLTLSSNEKIATMLLKIAFYQLPDNFLDTYIANIEAVTGAQIKSVFARHIQPQQQLLVTVGQS